MQYHIFTNKKRKGWPMANTKFSKQREAIKNYLANTTDHPTADVVYENIQKIYPNISLGTVYRNLNFLVEHGEILKLSCDDERDHYDANTNPHHHFYFRCCHRVTDLPIPAFQPEELLGDYQFPGQIDTCVTYFIGTCSSCMECEEVS